jgi:hypothetical protein
VDTGVLAAIVSAVIVGPLTALVGYGLARRQHRAPDLPESSEVSFVRIASPRDKAQVDDHFKVAGTYRSKPRAQVRTLILTDSGYWPQGVASFESGSERVWRADANFHGDPGSKGVLMVVLMGPDGQLLTNHYDKVGRLGQAWVALDALPTDSTVLDRIDVHR